MWNNQDNTCKFSGIFLTIIGAKHVGKSNGLHQSYKNKIICLRLLGSFYPLTDENMVNEEIIINGSISKRKAAAVMNRWDSNLLHVIQVNSTVLLLCKLSLFFYSRHHFKMLKLFMVWHLNRSQPKVLWYGVVTEPFLFKPPDAETACEEHSFAYTVSAVHCIAFYYYYYYYYHYYYIYFKAF